MATRTWELIERPKPEAKLGSVWVDPETHCRWLSWGDGRYVSEFGGLSWTADSAAMARVIARLVPAEGEA